jgi:hypothetical protein
MYRFAVRRQGYADRRAVADGHERRTQTEDPVVAVQALPAGCRRIVSIGFARRVDRAIAGEGRDWAGSSGAAEPCTASHNRIA